jgi:hypothetical protein
MYTEEIDDETERRQVPIQKEQIYNWSIRSANYFVRQLDFSYRLLSFHSICIRPGIIALVFKKDKWSALAHLCRESVDVVPD